MPASDSFLSNDGVVEFETLLQPHYAATEELIRDIRDHGQGSVVLVPQDTTSVNYRALEGVDGLGRSAPRPTVSKACICIAAWR